MTSQLLYLVFPINHLGTFCRFFMICCFVDQTFFERIVYKLKEAFVVRKDEGGGGLLFWEHSVS